MNAIKVINLNAKKYEKIRKNTKKYKETQGQLLAEFLKKQSGFYILPTL